MRKQCVIATRNGLDCWLEHYEYTVRQAHDAGWDVCIVDTGSDKIADISFLDSLRHSDYTYEVPAIPNIILAPDGVYDTGAYVHAYRTLKEADRWLFLHDSFAPKEGFFEAMDAKLDEEEKKPRMWDGNTMFGRPIGAVNIGLVAWCAFPAFFDVPERQGPWVHKALGRGENGNEDLPPLGIFGPMFGCTRAFLDAADERGYLKMLPTNKEEAMACERGWAIMADLLGIPVVPHLEMFDEGMRERDEFKYGRKWRPGRQ